MRLSDSFRKLTNIFPGIRTGSGVYTYRMYETSCLNPTGQIYIDRFDVLFDVTQPQSASVRSRKPLPGKLLFGAEFLRKAPNIFAITNYSTQKKNNLVIPFLRQQHLRILLRRTSSRITTKSHDLTEACGFVNI